jgi:glycosyltransferase involved in cell wall biosynthesis/predicted GH43/DUF377 family glycosyl hydrolase
MTDVKRMSKICLNLIVKNEERNLVRMLSSVRNHIDCYAIVDTGSTDRTVEVISEYLRGIPGHVTTIPFENFGKTRNDALLYAQGPECSDLDFEYLLLIDADMEFVFVWDDWKENLNSPAYQAIQTSGGMSYSNVRLVRRNSGARYVGVTHEYLDIPGGNASIQKTDSFRFYDHADGSNRADKFDRDIALLKAELGKDDLRPRYQYYLAQSLRDAGRPAEAALEFGRRAEMGGWAEEVYIAFLNKARCLRIVASDMERSAQPGHREKLQEAVGAAMEASRTRPHRQESYVELASIHNQTRDHYLAAMFADAGMNLPYPKDDTLFIEDYAFHTGLKQEYCIAANYLTAYPKINKRGYDICEELALRRGDKYGDSRDLARSNISYYAKMLHEIVPSFVTGQIGFRPPDGFLATNPSVAWHDGRLWVYQRTVNYSIMPDGSYAMRETTPGEAGVVETRNFLIELDDDLQCISASEVLPPEDLPEPVSRRQFRGLEDGRIVSHGGQLRCSSTACELTAKKYRQILVASITVRGRGEPTEEPYRMTDWHVIRPGDPAAGGPDLGSPTRHEKNWMPIPDGEGEQTFIYSVDPGRFLDATGQTVRLVPEQKLDLTNLRGGSQAVPFGDNWLVLVHEVILRDSRRAYMHRFVIIDREGVAKALSKPFYLAVHGAIEFVCGLAWASPQPGSPENPHDKLIITYGVEDRESWIGTVLASEVLKILRWID